jgi:hypothetical protein
MEPMPRGERVIIETRYGGTYEGGSWAAFPSSSIPEDARGDDLECLDWWMAPTVAVGVGDTPDEALDSLERAVRACEHPNSSRAPAPVGFTCRYCGLIVQGSMSAVENLLEVVRGWSPLSPLNLWVPSNLTLDGDPIDDGAAMALIGDAVTALGLVLRGVTDREGGKVFHFGSS